MNTFSVGDVISKAFDFAKNNLIFILIILVISMLPNVASRMSSGEMSPADIQRYSEALSKGDTQTMLNIYGQIVRDSVSAVTVIISLLMSLICIGLKAGVYNSMLRITRGVDESFSMSAFSMPLDVYVKYILTSIICGILIGIATLFCIIPGIFVGIKLMYAPLSIINDNSLSIGDAMKASWSMTKGNVGSLFLLGLAVIGISIVGLICCCIGMLFTNVIVEAAFVLAFVAINGFTTPMEALMDEKIDD